MADIDLAAEEWRPVPGFEQTHEVSDRGRVRSLERHVKYQDGRERTYPEKMLRLVDGTTGYLRVNIATKGENRVKKVHHLVALAFIGPRPAGMDVCHNNGDRLDNRACNLRYATRSENLRDAVRHGTNWNTAKTHCPQGHPYSAENTLLNSNGRRECATCRRARNRARFIDRKAVS